MFARSYLYGDFELHLSEGRKVCLLCFRKAPAEARGAAVKLLANAEEQARMRGLGFG